ncbi:flagellar hook-basal body complex protein FliE [Paraherbaspirillum soli]|uniref:Flagellar hook-basal body complex protein FliE n=1 Tax=Paraherbaspirillum soli TaxID=631222 RepID=A0ABW0MEJ2_9BURK
MTPIAAIAMSDLGTAALPPQMATSPIQNGSFSNMVLSGLNKVDDAITTADAAVVRFAADGSVPPHQVMLALEEARSSLQLATQVRSRLLEGYQELMRMQL